MPDLRERIENTLFEQELSGRWPLLLLGWGSLVVTATLLFAGPAFLSGRVDVQQAGTLLTGLVLAFWGGSELAGTRWVVGALRVCAVVCLVASTALIVVDVLG